MTEVLTFADGNLTFEQWLEKVDTEIVRLTSLSRDDLSDWAFADAFGDEVEPVDAAHMMIADQPHGRHLLRVHGIDPDRLF